MKRSAAAAPIHGVPPSVSHWAVLARHVGTIEPKNDRKRPPSDIPTALAEGYDLETREHSRGGRIPNCHKKAKKPAPPEPDMEPPPPQQQQEEAPQDEQQEGQGEQPQPQQQQQPQQQDDGANPPAPPKKAKKRRREADALKGAFSGSNYWGTSSSTKDNKEGARIVSERGWAKGRGLMRWGGWSDA
ncbi:unnamed protein product [Vitrella brassicaformis CCMP3155]|uniref:Uncharacterized protein n=1 Tax=Vitrella brassicaformis (strain CCMP3155) TaxID=1169540 RepID=A0A0G4GJ01_VITBC|nr:unnamed protein product [Vitrella brassicaformis CCMP3155]|eukprot:CEM29806.1 unnamed protein product [Vitrella brassicaformis CCMP3155]